MQELSTERLILVLQSDSAQGSLIQAVLVEDLQSQIIAINNTPDALDFLHHQEKYTDSQRPDLILLDLDLDGDKSGYDLLSIIKTDSDLKRIPIIVLSISERMEDIFKTYAVQSNCYVIRPSDREQLAQKLRRIRDFWLGIVTLPQK